MTHFSTLPASFDLPPQARLYRPPPIAAIPVVRGTQGCSDEVWSEPEQQEVTHCSTWAWYREQVPELDVFHPGAQMYIHIRALWLEGMRLHCYARPAYHERHDMQLEQCIILPQDERTQYEAWMAAYTQLKARALEWLSYARAYVYRSLFLDAEERKLMGAISWLESLQHGEKAYADFQITTTALARQCSWMITPFYDGFIVPDTRRVLFHLTALIERGYLEEKGVGPKGTTYGTVGYPHEKNRDLWHTYPRWEELREQRKAATIF